METTLFDVHSLKGRLVAGTGSHCPVSGIWAPAGERDADVRVLEGSIMPTHRSAAVIWQFVAGFRRNDLRR